MASFYHFLPALSSAAITKHGRLDRDVLLKHSLDEVLGDVELANEHAIVVDVTRGPAPNERGGVLIYPRVTGVDDPYIGVDHERQQWYTATPQEAQETPGRWIGWLRSAPPSPDDLVRRSTCPGYLVRDEHGRQWQVPIVRSPHSPFGALPKDLVFDAAGQVVPKLKSRYRALWESLAPLWDVLNGTPVAPEVDNDEGFVPRTAAAGLAVNYRLGPQEITALYEAGVPVLDDATARSICFALVDYDAIVRAEKKT